MTGYCFLKGLESKTKKRKSKKDGVWGVWAIDLGTITVAWAGIQEQKVMQYNILQLPRGTKRDINFISKFVVCRRPQKCF